MSKNIDQARARIATWVKEIKSADSRNRAAVEKLDSQSLERAADLEQIYQDMQWVKDIPAPVRKIRGRRVDPKSREQFAKWVKQQYDWGTHQRLSQLHIAHELSPILATAVAGIVPTGERVLRPLARLRKAGYDDMQAKVWSDAVEAADGEPPTSTVVGRMVTRYLNAQKSNIPNLARDRRTPQQRKDDRRKKLLAEFHAMMEDDNREANKFLDEAEADFAAYQEVRKAARTAGAS